MSYTNQVKRERACPIIAHGSSLVSPKKDKEKKERKRKEAGELQLKGPGLLKD